MDAAQGGFPRVRLMGGPSWGPPWPGSSDGGARPARPEPRAVGRAVILGLGTDSGTGLRGARWLGLHWGGGVCGWRGLG